jgi:hypothetical protein
VGVIEWWLMSQVEDAARGILMIEASESPKVCRACGAANDPSAQRCVTCGADFESIDQSARSFVDDDPALTHVDAENRVELDRFERMDQAEFACGLLRSNNIPCEVSSTALPGLPADLILWVKASDAKLAWALLADTERGAAKKRNDAA